MALDVFISPSGYVYLNELYVPGTHCKIIVIYNTTVNDNLWLKIQCLTGYRPTALQMIGSQSPGSASKLAYDWLVDILGFAVAF